MQKYIIAYDSDCGPCNIFKILVNLFDRYDKIDFMSIFEADSIGLLKPVPSYKKYDSFHLIFPTGKVVSGSDAIIDLINIFPLGHYIIKIILVLPSNRILIKYIYQLFSNLRKYSACKAKNKKQ